MIKILKSIIEYHKNIFLTGFGFIVLLNLALILFGDWNAIQADVPGLRFVWFVPIGLVILILNVSLNHEHRYRLYCKLPTGKENIFFAKLTASIAFWIAVLLIHFCFYLIVNVGLPNAFWVYDNISYTGLILIFINIPTIYSDLNSTISSKFQQYFLAAVWSVLMLSVTTYVLLSIPLFNHLAPEYISTFGTKFKSFYFSQSGSLIILMAGLLLSVLSLIVFKKRKTYL